MTEILLVIWRSEGQFRGTVSLRSVMAPDPKITKAFKAMKLLGISENKVKPVLKRLLKLYDKNWELIEGENYRVLADAIFEEEDNKVHYLSLPITVWFVIFILLASSFRILFLLCLSNHVSFVFTEIRCQNRRNLKLL